MLPWVEVSAILNFRIAITVWWAIFKYGISQWIWSDLHIVSPVYELTSCFHDRIWLIVVFFFEWQCQHDTCKKSRRVLLAVYRCICRIQEQCSAVLSRWLSKNVGLFYRCISSEMWDASMRLGSTMHWKKKEDRCLNNFV